MSYPAWQCLPVQSVEKQQTADPPEMVNMRSKKKKLKDRNLSNSMSSQELLKKSGA